MTRDAAITDARRPPPKAVEFLLPVWGKVFIKHFLAVGLPTLLAPGNIPAVAARLPSTFVFLTSEEDVEQLRTSPAVQHLAKFCKVEFRFVNDLITRGIHSVTITLAYARSLLAAGASALDTCYFFLVSDYIVADGSLGHVLDRVMDGASGVLAGNFQVVEPFQFDGNDKEETAPLARAVAPRDLMRKALDCLHPVTAANVVNFSIAHNTQCNRLFWRVDQNTLIGRFYLLHMICIRPERTDFRIGASCDYSFIPELCPSGRVVAMTDSDDYLVIEGQPRLHETNFLKFGPIEQAIVARNLSEWTTREHRLNAGYSYIFHAEAVPDSTSAMIAEADHFITAVARSLTSQPQPHRKHRYWNSAIAAFLETHSERQLPVDLRGIVVVDRLHVLWTRWFMYRIRYMIFGREPDVRIVHPLWVDYRVQIAALQNLLSGPDKNILAIASNDYLIRWASGHFRHVTCLHPDMLPKPGEPGEENHGNYDAGFIQFFREDLPRVGDAIECVVPRLKPGALLLIMLTNNWDLRNPLSFERHFVTIIEQFLRQDATLVSTQFVPSGIFRATASIALLRAASAALRRPFPNLIFALLLVPPLGLLTVILNMLAARGARHRDRGPRHNPPSTCLILLRTAVEARKMRSSAEAARSNLAEVSA